MDVNFLHTHQLSKSYWQVAEQYFVPLVKWFALRAQAHPTPLVVGINGSQGAGKSTLADFWVNWCESYGGLKACAVSIDDFYLTKVQRQQLAERVHPLLATRGVPGTHDVPAGTAFFDDIQMRRTPLAVPRFNKAQDDPFPNAQWPILTEPVDIIFFEGWCVGSMPQSAAALGSPVNELEAKEDPEAVWRTYVNEQLSGPYQQWFSALDYLVMLKAPSFDCVADWRWHQEEKLGQKLSAKARAQASGLMSREAVKRFVSFYERITQDNLSRMPARADVVFWLDSALAIEQISGKLVQFKPDGGFEFDESQ